MRTKPTEDLPRYKGPQARRSIKSIMEPLNKYSTRRAIKNQEPTIGWRYGSNEKLNRSGSESDVVDVVDDEDDVDYFENTEMRNKAQLKGSRGFHDEASYEHSKQEIGFNVPGKKLRYIPECAEYRFSDHLLNKTKVADLNKIDQQENYSPKQNIVSSNERSASQLDTGNWIYVIIFILVPFFVCVFMIENSEPLSNEKQLRNEIKNIRSTFPSQEEDIWYMFSSGIKEVEGNPTHPSVFLILYDRGEDTSACLAVKIAKAAMKFLNATKSGPIILDGVELGKNKTLIKDYGEFIAEKKLKVEEHRTMIIKNIHKVPGKVAQSFHSLCDTYTPLVDKAVYLFTLQAVGASNADHPTALAEEELERTWRKELHEDKLKPLITRITDNVIVVKSEESLSSSCKNAV